MRMHLDKHKFVFPSFYLFPGRNVWLRNVMCSGDGDGGDIKIEGKITFWNMQKNVCGKSFDFHLKHNILFTL